MRASRVDSKTIDARQQRRKRGDGIAGFKGWSPVWLPGTAENSMNPINNVGSNASVQKIYSKPVQKQIPADAPKSLPATDRLELSGVGHLLKTLKSSGDIRADKVASIKAQIESGTYEDDKKLDAATDKLLDDLLK